VDAKRRGGFTHYPKIFATNARIADSVCDKEQDCIDNYPENLQGTERYEQMEAAVDSLNDALEKIDDAKGHIESAIG